jgi:hypothetical protein
MNINSISAPLKALFSQSSINNLARKSGFISRLRGLEPVKLLAALCNVLGTKDKANLADIQRELCALSVSAPAYKPFHNQFKKEKLTDFMRNLVMRATEQLLVSPFITGVSDSLPFQRIHVHDGSTLKLHDGLKKTFPGRFTQTAPAAVELHLTMDLLSGGVDYMAIDADKESERLWQPYANESAGTLNLLDAGYFDIDYVSQTAKTGGHCIIRAKSNINPVIINARNEDGRRVKRLEGQQLKSVKLKQDEILDLNVSWQKHDGTFRIIASWDKRHQRHGYLITTLARNQFSAKDIQQYYALRWQVELLFKELKSYCNLSTFSTENEHIVRTLIWSSLLVMLLKRYMALATSALYNVAISTQKAQRSASSWIHYWIRALKGEITTEYAMEHIVSFLNISARRANPKRDSGSLSMKLKLFEADFVEEVVNI